MYFKNSRKDTLPTEAMIMFCGLPMGVEAEPMFVEVAKARINGAGLNPLSMQLRATMGVMKRHCARLPIVVRNYQQEVQVILTVVSFVTSAADSAPTRATRTKNTVGVVSAVPPISLVR
eukprot:gb/GECG01016309.1/.p1 GENE.gb/GECG01016309.1/~~gb/GECG01016309.1/.p1  ORF type:complete len:119 (+),score=8.08 gb/GECG01016309.1/:1-357(+)